MKKAQIDLTEQFTNMYIGSSDVAQLTATTPNGDSYTMYMPSDGNYDAEVLTTNNVEASLKNLEKRKLDNFEVVFSADTLYINDDNGYVITFFNASLARATYNYETIWYVICTGHEVKKPVEVKTPAVEEVKTYRGYVAVAFEDLGEPYEIVDGITAYPINGDLWFSVHDVANKVGIVNRVVGSIPTIFYECDKSDLLYVRTAPKEYFVLVSLNGLRTMATRPVHNVRKQRVALKELVPALNVGVQQYWKEHSEMDAVEVEVPDELEGYIQSLSDEVNTVYITIDGLESRIAKLEAFRSRMIEVMHNLVI